MTVSTNALPATLVNKTMIEALYLHIPYCKQRCTYCGFYSKASQETNNLSDGIDTKLSKKLRNGPEHLSRFEEIRLYVDELCGRIKALGEAGLLTNLKTLYIGGGTPSLLSPRQIKSILLNVHAAMIPAQKTLRAQAVFCARETQIAPETLDVQTPNVPQKRENPPQKQLHEITVEVNPESLTSDFLDACREQNVTRISLGIQSMDDAELAAVERCASVRNNEHALTMLQNYPFAVSADVIAGLPGQTTFSFEKTVRMILAYDRVNHVSVYPLSVEKGTLLYKRCQEGTAQIPNEDAQVSLLERADRLLQERGFYHYEVANYARPGFEAEHNTAYWTGKEYLGLGPSASSMVSRRTYAKLQKVLSGLPCLNDLPKELARLRIMECVCQESYELEGLTYEQSAAEDLMLASRLQSGLDDAVISHAEVALGKEKVTATLRSLCEQGFLQTEQVSDFSARNTLSARAPIIPTPKGWLLGNVMFSRLWDLAPTTRTFALVPQTLDGS